MTKQSTLERQVKALAKTASVTDIAEALGDLVVKRMEKPKKLAADPHPEGRYGAYYAKPESRSIFDDETATRRASSAKHVRGGRRRGRIQSYTPTDKRNDARWNTWRHYMIDVVLRHKSTLSAETDHETNCTNPKFAKNRLDFGWCASNGFITFD